MRNSESETNVVCQSTGQMSYSVYGSFSVSCNIDASWFPFDEQRCRIMLASRSYKRHELDLTTSKLDMGSYGHNSEWDIIGKRTVHAQYIDRDPHE